MDNSRSAQAQKLHGLYSTEVDSILEAAADATAPNWVKAGILVNQIVDENISIDRLIKSPFDTIAEQGGLSADDADEYLDNLRQEGRYQRDVY